MSHLLIRHSFSSNEVLEIDSCDLRIRTLSTVLNYMHQAHSLTTRSSRKEVPAFLRHIAVLLTRGTDIDGDKEVKDYVCPKKLKNKMVFISGWTATCLYWTPQVRWFGGGVPLAAGDEEEEEEYTVLVFDNRGIGNSGYPRGPYT